MDLRPEELLRAIRLPRSAKQRTHYYRKVGTRKAQAISKVCFAAMASMNEDQIEDVRIALGSVAPIPIRCVQTENAIRNKVIDGETANAAQAALTKDISPIDDLRSTRDYRLRVSLNLLANFLQNLAQSS